MTEGDTNPVSLCVGETTEKDGDEGEAGEEKTMVALSLNAALEEGNATAKGDDDRGKDVEDGEVAVLTATDSNQDDVEVTLENKKEKDVIDVFLADKQDAKPADKQDNGSDLPEKE